MLSDNKHYKRDIYWNASGTLNQKIRKSIDLRVFVNRLAKEHKPENQKPLR